MSYVIHIWEEPIPTSLEHAGELIAELIRAPKTAEPNPKYVEAAERLTAKYPFEQDLGVDPEGEVWSDGPLMPRRGDRIWGVGLLSQSASEVQPFVVTVANQLGLVVYDMQIHPPVRVSTRSNGHRGFSRSDPRYSNQNARSLRCMSPNLAHRDGRPFDGQPSLSGHCGHGPIFIAQRSVANGPTRKRRPLARRVRLLR